MKPEDLAALPKDTLVSLLEVCIKSLQTVDGLWFREVEDSHGLQEATRIDRKVWERLAISEAQRLKKALGLEGNDLATVMKALDWNPSWMAFGAFESEQLSSKEAVFRSTDCLSQKRRLNQGRSLFPCKEVGEPYFRNFAQALNPKIEVRCEVAPPDNHREDLWCQWRFTLEEPEEAT